MTLSMFRWYPSTSSGKPIDGPDDPYLETFTIAGLMHHTREEGPEWSELAPYPAFRLVPADVQRPAVSGAAVHLAINAYHPKVPGAALCVRWNPLAPSSPYSLTVDGWEKLPMGGFNLLTSEGFRLLSDQLRDSGGRPRGVFDRELDYYLYEYRQQRHKLGRPVPQVAFIKDLRAAEHARGNKKLVGRSTLKRNLEGDNLWPYELFQAAAEVDFKKSKV
jgi:hypothetical protein